MPLRTLDEHNASRIAAAKPDSIALNGIACPKCGGELFDSDPNKVLTSNPPQTRTACSKWECDYNGLRFL